MKLEQEIVNRIRELRTSKNMTQEQLADKIGFAVSYLGRIEWEVCKHSNKYTGKNYRSP